MVEKAGCCFADCLLAGRIQALFNLLCVRLPAVKYQKSVASAVIFKLAEAVLQVALSRLTEAVFRQPAVNYQPSVVRLLYFSHWQSQDHSPVGSFLAGSGSVQAAGCKL